MVGDEVMFNGVELCAAYNFIVAHFEEVPPAPKTEVIEIPFGEDIDITDKMGTVHYGRRTHKIEFLCKYHNAYNLSDFMSMARGLAARVHGKRGNYTLSWDPGYTYTGRWRVTGYDFTDKLFGKVTVEIDCDPYKTRNYSHTFDIREGGSSTRIFNGAQVPVHPTFRFNESVTVGANGKSEAFTSGTKTAQTIMVYYPSTSMTFSGDWYFYYLPASETLVVNDAYISYDEASKTITLADAVFEALSDGVLTLDNTVQMATISYQMKDL